LFIKTDGDEAINSLFIESLYIVKVADVPQGEVYEVFAVEAKLISGVRERIGCYDEATAHKKFDELIEMLNSKESPAFEEVRA